MKQNCIVWNFPLQYHIHSKNALEHFGFQTHQVEMLGLYFNRVKLEPSTHKWTYSKKKGEARCGGACL